MYYNIQQYHIYNIMEQLNHGVFSPPFPTIFLYNYGITFNALLKLHVLINENVVGS